MKNKWLILAGAVAVTAFSTVQATPTLDFRISTDGVTWSTSSSGFSGITLGTWNIKTIAGTLTGTSTFPIIDLDSLDVSGSGTLYVEMTVTGVGPTTGVASGHLGGNLNGGDSVNWSGYAASSDTAFDTGAGTQIFLVTGLTGAVNSSASGPVNQPNLYSLTEEFVITSTGGNSDSLDGQISVPDGGSTAAMLGLALSGIGLVFVRNRKARCA